MIMHDSDTFRTTGHKGEISEMTLAELKQLDCGEREKIPTLRELIDLAKGKIGLQCEIKAKGIAKKVAEMFIEADLIESTIISSFYHDELKIVQKVEPSFKLASLEPTGTGWVTAWIFKKKIIDKAVENKFPYIHPLYKLVNKEFVEYAHKNNLKVNTWTVDIKSEIKKLVDCGIDGIVTNDVVKAKEVLNR